MHMFGIKKHSKEDREARRFLRDAQLLLRSLSETISQHHHKDDVASELEMLETLADRGLAEAQYLHGLFMLDVDNDWYDPHAGTSYLERAAKVGIVDAQFDLAIFLLHGSRDFPKDPVTGNYWMMQAAERGFPAAVRYREDRI